ncbi:uncharacterized protein LOC107359480 [Tetranychus urticae]|uniref:Lipocalin/cytosolic fatty-acid binding domain-containing protein n=1 Tax=Tetranychus urticae TaxID=32264 RepID=T1K3P3_TETUR|nr:uncharacterized protein LOC107359480 [Tetranychus urticae]
MKSTLFVVLIALAISSSFAVKIQGSCPNPEQPKIDYWTFSNFLGSWTVLGRSEQTVPRTVYNTIEIDHLYPGKVAVIEEGNTRDIDVMSLWDNLIELTVGDFNGKSYYDVIVDDDEPYSFNITTSDGHQGIFWMPFFARPKYAEAVLASCVKIDESTVDIKAWFVSKNKYVKASEEVEDIVESLTGRKLVEVCQGDFC